MARSPSVTLLAVCLRAHPGGETGLGRSRYSAQAPAGKGTRGQGERGVGSAEDLAMAMAPTATLLAVCRRAHPGGETGHGRAC
eukprot:1468859-Amphidinium_carterae.1